jgi:hypothetical protein
MGQGETPGVFVADRPQGERGIGPVWWERAAFAATLTEGGPKLGGAPTGVNRQVGPATGKVKGFPPDIVRTAGR